MEYNFRIPTGNGRLCGWELTWFELCTGQIHNEEWRVVLRRDVVGDPGAGTSAPSGTVGRPRRRGEPSPVRARGGVGGVGRVPVSSGSLPPRYLRPDVRVLASSAHRKAFLPRDPSLPAAQESRLLTVDELLLLMMIVSFLHLLLLFLLFTPTPLFDMFGSKIPSAMLFSFVCWIDLKMHQHRLILHTSL